MKGQTDEFCIHSDGQDGVHCSGCLPPAVSGGADCRRNEPSDGVYVTGSADSRRSWHPDVDRGLFCYLELALVPKIGAESSAEG